MESPQPIPSALEKNNIYALLSPINAALALLGSCVTLFSLLVPGLPFLCATISGLFSVGAVLTGGVGLMQIKHSGQKGRGLAITGIVLGILGILTACILPFIGTAVWAALGYTIGDTILVPIQ